jgi:hypothetical protein
MNLVLSNYWPKHGIERRSDLWVCYDWCGVYRFGVKSGMKGRLVDGRFIDRSVSGVVYSLNGPGAVMLAEFPNLKINNGELVSCSVA